MAYIELFRKTISPLLSALAPGQCLDFLQRAKKQGVGAVAAGKVCLDAVLANENNIGIVQ